MVSGETLARALPSGFAFHASRGRWRPAPHLNLLTEKLVDLSERRINRLIVEMPPRHGKSEECSQYFPGWYLCRRPDHRVMLGSYEFEYASSWGEKTRDVFAENAPGLFGLTLHPRRKSVDNWRIWKHLGGMVTTGVGGAMTGKGADLLIIDDPVKNAKEANSETYRQATWDWFTSTAYTRLEPGGVVVLIMTRWHEDDLAGRLLKAMKDGGEHWTRLSLPAVAEVGDPLGRQPGEALWPWRYPLSRLRVIEKTIGPYWWAALFQQRPQPAGGGIFKRQWFRYYTTDHAARCYILKTPQGEVRIPFDAGYRFSTTDPASSTRTTADYTVTSTWFCSHDSDLLLLNMDRDQIEGPDQLLMLENGIHRWGLSFAGVESKAYQQTIVQTLVRKGLPVQPLDADADKVSRALVAAARMSQGKMYLPAGAPYLDDIEGELLGFPRAAHDDIVDTFSYAAIHVAGGFEPRLTIVD